MTVDHCPASLSFRARWIACLAIAMASRKHRTAPIHPSLRLGCNSPTMCVYEAPSNLLAEFARPCNRLHLNDGKYWTRSEILVKKNLIWIYYRVTITILWSSRQMRRPLTVAND